MIAHEKRGTMERLLRSGREGKGERSAYSADAFAAEGRGRYVGKTLFSP